jgi:hypothetical protein
VILTGQQIRLFRHNGFLKIPEPLPSTIVDELKRTIMEDIRKEVEPVQRDTDGNIVRISSILGRAPIFLEAVSHPSVLDPLTCLLGPNIEAITNRHNHATLRTRTALRGHSDLHRDVLQWTRTIVTIIFYLEETTVENGCTLIVPGSHMVQWSTEKLYDQEGFSEVTAQAVPVPMPAGGMLAIDSTVVHGIGENHTDGTRMSMTVGYHSVDELMDVENPKRILVRGERKYGGNDG